MFYCIFPINKTMYIACPETGLTREIISLLVIFSLTDTNKYRTRVVERNNNNF